MGGVEADHEEENREGLVVVAEFVEVAEEEGEDDEGNENDEAGPEEEGLFAPTPAEEEEERTGSDDRGEIPAGELGEVSEEVEFDGATWVVGEGKSDAGFDGDEEDGLEEGEGEERFPGELAAEGVVHAEGEGEEDRGFLVEGAEGEDQQIGNPLAAGEKDQSDGEEAEPGEVVDVAAVEFEAGREDEEGNGASGGGEPERGFKNGSVQPANREGKTDEPEEEENASDEVLGDEIGFPVEADFLHGELEAGGIGGPGVDGRFVEGGGDAADHPGHEDAVDVGLMGLAGHHVLEEGKGARVEAAFVGEGKFGGVVLMQLVREHGVGGVSHEHHRDDEREPGVEAEGDGEANPAICKAPCADAQGRGDDGVLERLLVHAGGLR